MRMVSGWWILPLLGVNVLCLAGLVVTFGFLATTAGLVTLALMVAGVTKRMAPQLAKD